MRHEPDDYMAEEQTVRFFKKKVEQNRVELEKRLGGEEIDSWVKRNEKDLRNRLISLSSLTYSIDRMIQEPIR